MIDLIRKRHDGEAWVVMTELANATGGAVSRHADAAALGLWPSRGHQLIGYEIKRSRGDVQKELNDPRKADAVGKYCDEWWLVVEDLSIIDGLVIPETWGILVPKNKVLRIHRKAPKLEAKPLTRGFAAAMIRNVTKSWVPRSEYNELREKQREQLLKELERDRQWAKDDHQRELDALKAKVAAFEQASGVEIHHYMAGQIGEAVKMVLDARSATGKQFVENQIRSIDRVADQHDHIARNARSAADSLRKMLGNGGDQQELSLVDQRPLLRGLHG